MSVKKLSSVFKTGCELKITRPQAEALKHLYFWHKNKRAFKFILFAIQAHNKTGYRL